MIQKQCFRIEFHFFLNHRGFLNIHQPRTPHPGVTEISPGIQIDIKKIDFSCLIFHLILIQSQNIQRTEFSHFVFIFHLTSTADL